MCRACLPINYLLPDLILKRRGQLNASKKAEGLLGTKVLHLEKKIESRPATDLADQQVC